MKHLSKEKRKQRHQRKKHKMDTLSMIILVIAIAVFAVSAFMLVKSLLPYIQGGAEYDKIKELIVDNNDASKDDSTEAAADGFTVDFASLSEINPDTVAWIRFDEPSIISYPVVQCTDNSTYLTKSFQANDNKLGAIFMAAECKSDFSDRASLIYGHNLNWGGEMFSQLNSYESESFCREHPYFYIYTPNGKVSTYQVFAAAVVKDTSEQYIVAFNSDEEYQAHLNLIQSESAYPAGVQVNITSQIVSLSTCTNVNEDERFLLHGVKVDEKDFKQ